MNREERQLTLKIIIGLAILSQALWLLELTVRIGWKGLAWLKIDLVSPILIGLFAALAYITPFWVRYRQIDTRIILTVLTFYMINLSCYLLSCVLFKSLQTQGTLFLQIIRILIFIVFISGYYYVTNELIMPIKKHLVALFLLCIIFMYVLSLISVFVIKGFGTGTQWIDAVKMGYPQLWLCVLLGFSGIYLVKNAED
jgi:hypothetical protein